MYLKVYKTWKNMCVCLVLSHVQLFTLRCGCWVAQMCVKLIVTPTDSSSSAHGIFQARILEWVAISFSRGLSPPRDWTHVSCIVGGFFTHWAIREAWKNIKTQISLCGERKVFPLFLLVTLPHKNLVKLYGSHNPITTKASQWMFWKGKNFSCLNVI